MTREEYERKVKGHYYDGFSRAMRETVMPYFYSDEAQTLISENYEAWVKCLEAEEKGDTEMELRYNYASPSATGYCLSMMADW